MFLFRGEEEYEVLDENKTKAIVVKLNDFWCQCGRWQINGISCKHVMRCINSRRYDPVTYIHLSLTKEIYLQTYTSMIHPIPDEALRPEVDFDHVMAPIIKRKLEKPKVLRRREADEPTKEKMCSTVKCGICKVIVKANLKRKRPGEVFLTNFSFVLIEFVFYFFHYHQTY